MEQIAHKMAEVCAEIKYHQKMKDLSSLTEDEKDQSCWMLSRTSNIHIVSNVDWFTTIVSFRTTVFDNGGHEFDSCTVGMVDIPIETNKGSGVLTLKNCVYLPEFPYNVIGYGALEPAHGCSLSPFKDGDSHIWLTPAMANGLGAALDRDNGQFKLKISGNHPNLRSVFSEDCNVLPFRTDITTLQRMSIALGATVPTWKYVSNNDKYGITSPVTSPGASPTASPAKLREEGLGKDSK